MNASTVPRLTRVVLTGEYPPGPGGVSDLSRLLAVAMARRGEAVHVFAPASGGDPPGDGGVAVSALPRGYSPGALAAMRRTIEALPSPRRVLVHYVPHAFGLKAMNVPFCLWLRSLRDPVDVLFHEVAFPWSPLRRPRHDVLALVTRLMARIAGGAADRVFVSTTAWEPLLRRLGVHGVVRWVPMPSNLPVEVDPARTARLREALPGGGRVIVGHFGTFGEGVTTLLAPALAALLRGGRDRTALLVGRGSREFAMRTLAADPGLQGRLVATGGLPPSEAAEHLAACELLVQPFPDGVTTRRGSLMAGLALGVPVVSSLGPLTEPFWRENPGPALAPGPDGVAALAEELLADPVRLAKVGADGAALYRRHLSLERCLEVLTAEPSGT